MIFVMVGTHEQQFDRLIQCVDNLKAERIITEEVIMQTGFSMYIPRYCKWNNLFSYKDMQKHIADARIVITHGGPSSFITPLQIGKIPIVLPRQKKYKEHVNDHQLMFCKAVEERNKNIIVVEETKDLKETIEKYDELIKTRKNILNSNNDRFCTEFEKIVNSVTR